MLLRDISYSKNVFEKLLSIRLKNPSKSYSLYKYIKKINEYVDFFLEELEKIKNKYNIKNEIGSNDLEYLKEVSALLDIELSDLPNLDITIDDVLEADFGDNPENWLTPDDYNKLFIALPTFNE